MDNWLEIAILADTEGSSLTLFPNKLFWGGRDTLKTSHHCVSEASSVSGSLLPIISLSGAREQLENASCCCKPGTLNGLFLFLTVLLRYN